MPGYSIGDVLLMILYLALIIAGAYFATRAVGKLAMRRGMNRGGKKQAGRRAQPVNGKYLRVVDRIPVDRDKSMFLLECAGKRYLMSATADEVRLVDKMPIPQEEMQEAEEETAPAESADSFGASFMANMRREWNVRLGRKKAAPQPESASFEQKLDSAIKQDTPIGGDSGDKDA